MGQPERTEDVRDSGGQSPDLQQISGQRRQAEPRRLVSSAARHVTLRERLVQMKMEEVHSCTYGRQKFSSLR